jgi:hypothetical protein
MIGLALIVTVAFTVWCIYAEAQDSLTRLSRVAATPVIVVLEEQVIGVEEKVRMLDEIFNTARRPDEDETDPPTVVMDRR